MKAIALLPREHPEGAATALRAIAVALAPYLREVFAQSNADEFVDAAACVPRPRRVVFAACRSGAIEGACKSGRTWLAKRGAIDAWLRSQGPRLVGPATHEAPDDDLESLRVAIAKVPTGRRRVGA